MATVVLALVLAFLSPFTGSVLTFLLGNGEKRRILSQSGVILFGAFGWAFARAHCDLRRRFTFHRSWLKAGICCARRGSREGRSCCRRGWLSQWGARMHANKTWTFWRRSTTTASIRCEWRGWWSMSQRGRNKRGTGGGTGAAVWKTG